jgi:2-keto-4-pentenoate hydratase
VTKGLQESIHDFGEVDEEIELQPLLDDLVARPPLDLALGDATEAPALARHRLASCTTCRDSSAQPGSEERLMSSDVVFRDPLAGALWRARRDATMIAPTDHTELTPERGERVAAELYRAIEAGGGRQVGWKIGAGDAAAQARFGTDRPFTAPVLDASCLRDGAAPRLAGLVAPRLEAEIGLLGSLHLEVTA